MIFVMWSKATDCDVFHEKFAGILISRQWRLRFSPFFLSQLIVDVVVCEFEILSHKTLAENYVR